MVMASHARQYYQPPAEGRAIPKTSIETVKLDALMHEHEIFRSVLDNFPGGISLFDRNLRLVLCNKEMKELLEYPDTLFDFGPPNLEQIFRFNANRGEYGPGKVEDLVSERLKLVRLQRAHIYERTRPNGTVLEVRGVPLANGGFVSTYLDVTHQRARRQLQDDGINFDKLTKLPKRDFIERQLWQALQKLRLEEVACLHCLDLDKFAVINQRHGHIIADFVLKEVASRLGSAIRGFDFLARAGGDRFFVLQSSVRRPSDITKLATRMCDEIKAPITCGDIVVSVTASSGVALAPRDGRDVEGLIAKAEAMALKAKRREYPDEGRRPI